MPRGGLAERVRSPKNIQSNKYRVIVALTKETNEPSDKGFFRTKFIGSKVLM